MNINGKTILITGASTGIGRAIAVKLAEEKTNIIINYSSSKQEAETTLNMVKEKGSDGIIYRADVSKQKEVESMCREAVNQFESIDVLINNAGATNFVPLHDLEGMLDEYWDKALNVNVKGIFYTSRACKDELEKNNGSILNITSIAGCNGTGSSIAYAASKAAGISLTKSLARVFAPSVRVNSIAPGVVLTRWVEGQDEHIQKHSEGTPLGRPASPEDISNMAHALLKGGDFVTGQTIVVDGGYTIT
ncbi:SDR family NAD(P)-dependent oxidoreductase [Salibacterium aidingense]|uniref:SDR family NAD(P)-dependent oxidoreductase n=1 Tax=Salibacterium aidingense TaxID=384933 RepID=UPI000400D9AD|nr:SDR family oxidoreductase [Salibacterium aidingense]